jgi:hypothetical protein
MNSKHDRIPKHGCAFTLRLVLISLPSWTRDPNAQIIPAGLRMKKKQRQTQKQSDPAMSHLLAKAVAVDHAGSKQVAVGVRGLADVQRRLRRHFV